MRVYIVCGIINLTRQMDPSPACIWLKRSLERVRVRLQSVTSKWANRKAPFCRKRHYSCTAAQVLKSNPGSTRRFTLFKQLPLFVTLLPLLCLPHPLLPAVAHSPNIVDPSVSKLKNKKKSCLRMCFTFQRCAPTQCVPNSIN